MSEVDFLYNLIDADWKYHRLLSNLKTMIVLNLNSCLIADIGVAEVTQNQYCWILENNLILRAGYQRIVWAAEKLMYPMTLKYDCGEYPLKYDEI